MVASTRRQAVSLLSQRTVELALANVRPTSVWWKRHQGVHDDTTGIRGKRIAAVKACSSAPATSTAPRFTNAAWSGLFAAASQNFKIREAPPRARIHQLSALTDLRTQQRWSDRVRLRRWLPLSLVALLRVCRWLHTLRGHPTVLWIRGYSPIGR